jgi:hypothetical protein
MNHGGVNAGRNNAHTRAALSAMKRGFRKRRVAGQVRSGFTPVTSGPSKETSAPKHTDHWAPQLRTYTWSEHSCYAGTQSAKKEKRKKASDHSLTHMREAGRLVRSPQG